MPGRVGEARETDSQRSAPDGAVGRLARRSATAGVDIEGWCPPHKALGPTWQHEHPSTRGGPERSTPIDQQVRVMPPGYPLSAPRVRHRVPSNRASPVVVAAQMAPPESRAKAVMDPGGSPSFWPKLTRLSAAMRLAPLLT